MGLGFEFVPQRIRDLALCVHSLGYSFNLSTKLEENHSSKINFGYFFEHFIPVGISNLCNEKRFHILIVNWKAWNLKSVKSLMVLQAQCTKAVISVMPVGEKNWGASGDNMSSPGWNRVNWSAKYRGSQWAPCPPHPPVPASLSMCAFWKGDLFFTSFTQ